VSEVIDPGALKQVPGQFGRLTNIPADIQHVVNKVPGFTTSQGTLFCLIALKKELKQILVIIQSIV
jgi:hypothetical protein